MTTTSTSDMSQASLSSDFDAWSQMITILVPGDEPGELSLDDIFAWEQYAVRTSTFYATQFGVSLVVLILMLVLTKSDKRRSLIFFTNCLGLFFNSIKTILQTVYFVGPFYHPYTYFAADTSRVPDREVATSVTSTIFTLLAYACVLVSLNLQMQVMLTAATASLQRIAVTSLSILLALLTISFRFSILVINSKYIVAKKDQSSWQWLPLAASILFTITICFSSGVFCCKLFFAIRQRRSIGMQDFGPLQVLFTMALQTLLIPVVFVFLQFIPSLPQFGTLALTVTLVCLPMSSLWAGAVVGERQSSPLSKSAFSQMLRWGGTLVE